MGKLIKLGLTVLILNIAPLQAAEPPKPAEPVKFYNVDYTKSYIQFSATQNDSPIGGRFDKFDAKIRFSPDAPSMSSAIVTVDMGSVNAEYGEVVKTLKLPLWFSVDLFPKAIFTTKSITFVGGNRYKAVADLTIRDKTVPTELDFTLTEFSPTKAVVDGSTTLKRTAFGVGQGEWQETTLVKDDVHVTIHLEATPAPAVQ